MNDLISRQAAIDAFKEEFYMMYADDFNYLINWFNNLPTAEPEIIKCKDCRYYNAGFECLIEGYGIERDKEWFCADAERK